LGDTTARDQGRLTLNPLRHIDPIGSILVPLILSLAGGVLLAWARPVPVRTDRLRDPVNDHAKVAAAGPASNLVLAACFALVGGLVMGLVGSPGSGAAGAGFRGTLLFVFQIGVLANVWLAVFNLLPLPPLDGSWILARFLPPGMRHSYLGLARFGFLAVLGFIVVARYTDLGNVLFGFVRVLLEPFQWIFQTMASLGG